VVEQAIAESPPERASYLTGLVSQERALAIDHDLQAELAAVLAHAKNPHGPTLTNRDWGPDSPPAPAPREAKAGTSTPRAKTN
jgi:hypothetical protein